MRFANQRRAGQLSAARRRVFKAVAGKCITDLRINGGVVTLVLQDGAVLTFSAEAPVQVDIEQPSLERIARVP